MKPPEEGWAHAIFQRELTRAVLRGRLAECYGNDPVWPRSWWSFDASAYVLIWTVYG